MLKNFLIIRTLGMYNRKLIIFLGEGSFGTVYLVKRKTDGQFYALKKVSKSFLKTIKLRLK